MRRQPMFAVAPVRVNALIGAGKEPCDRAKSPRYAGSTLGRRIDLGGSTPTF
jgi:hypothetical protein